MKVHFQGIGHLNGPVIIDKIVELDEQYTSKLNGRDRDEVKKSIMAVYYPGVEINPNSITCIFVEEKKEIFSKESKNLMKGAVAGGVAATIVNRRKKNKTKSEVQQAQGSQRVDFTKELSPLLDILLSGTKENIQANLDKIFIALMSYKWAAKPVNDEIDKRNSIIQNKIYLHYKNGIRNLKKAEPDEEEIKDYIKQFKKLRLKKIFNEYGIWIFVIGIPLIFILITIIHNLLV